MSNTIVIVDDHNLFAQSLKVLVNSFKDFKVVQILKNGKELVDYLENSPGQPSIILLDMRMAVMDGMESMTWLKTHRPEQKVLALTVDQEEETILKMIKLGCRGYLLKDIEPEELERALKNIVEEGYYSNRTISDALDYKEKKRSFEALTKRELVFLNFACSEKTYKEIAGDMNLSPKTIDGYRESLFQKLQVKNRIGLVIFAIKEGICEI